MHTNVNPSTWGKNKRQHMRVPVSISLSISMVCAGGLGSISPNRVKAIWRAVLCSAAQCTAVQCSAGQGRVVQCSSVPCKSQCKSVRINPIIKIQTESSRNMSRLMEQARLKANRGAAPAALFAGPCAIPQCELGLRRWGRAGRRQTNCQQIRACPPRHAPSR